MTTLHYTTNPHTPLNTERWLYQLRLCQWRYANRGYGSKSDAARNLNRQRAYLTRMVKEMRGEPVAYTEIPDFETTIAGIPCGIKVTAYSPGKPWRQHTFKGAGPGDCDPPEPAECEFLVLDRKGYEAPWLEKKMTHADVERIEGMIGGGEWV